MGSFLKQEPGVEKHQLDLTPQPLGPLNRSCSPVRASQDRDGDVEALKPHPLPRHLPSPPPQQVERLCEKDGGQIKLEVSSYSCQEAYSPGLPMAEPKAEVFKDQGRARYPSSVSADAGSHESPQTYGSLERSNTAVCESQQPATPKSSHTPNQKESVSEAPVYPQDTSDSPIPLLVGSDDPMAGMLALLAASEIAQARNQTVSTLLPQTEISGPGADCHRADPLEMVALEGMALLSQMAEREMENISMEQGEEEVELRKRLENKRKSK